MPILQVTCAITYKCSVVLTLANRRQWRIPCNVKRVPRPRALLQFGSLLLSLFVHLHYASRKFREGPRTVITRYVCYEVALKKHLYNNIIAFPKTGDSDYISLSLLAKGCMVFLRKHVTRVLARTFANAMLTHYTVQTQPFPCQKFITLHRSRNLITVVRNVFHANK